MRGIERDMSWCLTPSLRVRAAWRPHKVSDTFANCAALASRDMGVRHRPARFDIK
jgi:hypothetical protein